MKMMNFLDNLEWHSHLTDFSRTELKVLLALSNEEYRWRSIDGLRAAVKSDDEELGDALKSLIERKMVRVSATKDLSKALFGLAERVDPELQVKSSFKRWPH